MKKVMNSNYVLRRSNSLEEMGSPHWSLTLCLLLAWILVAACIIQGIKSSGKVNVKSNFWRLFVCFLRLFILRHYFLMWWSLLWLFVVWLYQVERLMAGKFWWFCCKIGAANGISFYLKPNWSKIREFQVRE
jgi:SNF family Na+-dependent transporter